MEDVNQRKVNGSGLDHRGGPKKTVTKAFLPPEGDDSVERHDFSMAPHFYKVRKS